MTEKEFKKELADGIKEISLGLSSNMEPMEKSVLFSMTNLVYNRLVQSNCNVSDFETYKKTIDKILTGNMPFYKLNAINLLFAFSAEDHKKIIINTPPEWLQ